MHNCGKFVINKTKTMRSILQNNLERISTLCEANNVESLYAFGSVCTDKFTDASDVDLLISFKKMDFGDYADAYFFVADELEKIFQRPVDLITEKSLSNPYFIKSVNQSKVQLYG